MQTMTLEALYEKVKDHSIKAHLRYIPDNRKNDILVLSDVINRGASGFVFLSRMEKKMVAIRMSYEKDDFSIKFASLKEAIEDNYKNFLLQTLKQSEPHACFYTGSSREREKILFDNTVYVSFWEKADSDLECKLKEGFEKKFTWFQDFLQGLSFIHSRARAHFDIKLSNLFLVDNRIKIGDFEYYWKISDFVNSGTHFCGTKGYIAPELFWDRDNITPKIDIFSAGVAFARLFTGVNGPSPSKTPKDDPEIKEILNRCSQRYNFKQNRINEIGESLTLSFFYINLIREKIKKGKLNSLEMLLYKDVLLRMMDINPENRPPVDHILEMLKIGDSPHSEQEDIILGAGGSSQKIYIWNRNGDLKKKIDVVIGGEKKFAACVKYFDYKGDTYLAIGTSAGILIKSLSNPDFIKELPISDPDGNVGHFRAIEIIDDLIIGTNYHLKIREHEGFGLFKAELHQIVNMKGKNIPLKNIFNEVGGPMVKINHNGDDIIVFSSKKRLIQYKPRHGIINDLYHNEANITAITITGDGLILGDEKGYITLLNNHFKEIKKIHIKPQETAITALEYSSISGRHLFIGDELSFFSYYQFEGDQLRKIFSRPIGLRNPLDINTDESDIYPVLEIKYSDFNGTGWVFAACEKDLIAFSVHDILTINSDLFERKLHSFGESKHTIFSMDICKRERNV